MKQRLRISFVLLMAATLLFGFSNVTAQKRTTTIKAANATAAPVFDRNRYLIQHKKFVLDNGLTLVVHEDHSVPIVAVNLWYHVGSRNEKRGKTGFAHLFEHFFFNGSENYPHGFREAMDDLGANNRNGTTDSDRTNFLSGSGSHGVSRRSNLKGDARAGTRRSQKRKAAGRKPTLRTCLW